MAKESRQKLDNLLDVKTPENISFKYRLGGPFRRLLALALDILVSQLAYWIVAFIVLLLIALILQAGGGVGGAVNNMMSGIALAIGFFVYWFYGAIMETYWNGQSVGKMLMGLRVLRANGEAIDGTQALLRNFFRLMDFCPLVPLAVFVNVPLEEASFLFQIPAPTIICGLLVMTFSSKFQRVGDMVAGTIVVHEKATREHGLVKFADNRVPQLAELLPQDFFVNSDLAKALANYIDRRKYLPFQRTNEIAGHLAAPLLVKFGMRADTNHDLLLCALYYKTYISGSQEGEDDYRFTADALHSSNQFEFGQSHSSSLPSPSQIRIRK